MKFSQTIIQDKQQNIAWINNLRLIAMFAVVVLHTASPLLFDFKSAPLNQWLVADIYNALTRFCVPVFVMITGALLLNREYELSDFLKKRLGRLILPFIFWSLVYVAYKWYDGEIVITNNTRLNVKTVIDLLKTGSFYHLWYVYVLIGLYLLIPVIGKFVRNATEKELLYFLAVWLVTMLLTRPYLTTLDTNIDLHNFSGYVGYLVLGYYLAYKQFSIKNIPLITIIAFIACTVVMVYGTYYLTTTNHDLSTFFYEPIGPFVLILSICVFLMSRYTKVKLSPQLNGICANASKYTLGIYFSHALILALLDLADIDYSIFSPIFSIPLIALTCFLLSWLLVYILSKLPMLKYIVG